jgi:acyl-coenzyme A thioesterase 9
LWVEALAASTPGAGPPVNLKATSTIELTPRNMHDSYSELVLPFGSSKEVFEQYTNAWGGIRTGKYVLFFSQRSILNLNVSFAVNRIMEHLDSLAGSIAYKHMLGPVQSVGNLEQRGFYLVTASVDRFVLCTKLVFFLIYLRDFLTVWICYRPSILLGTCV